MALEKKGMARRHSKRGKAMAVVDLGGFKAFAQTLLLNHIISFSGDFV